MADLKYRTPFKCEKCGTAGYSYWSVPDKELSAFSIHVAPSFLRCACGDEYIRICGAHELCLGVDHNGVDIYSGDVLLGPSYSTPMGSGFKSTKTKFVLFKIRYAQEGMGGWPGYHLYEIHRCSILRTYPAFKDCVVVGSLYAKGPDTLFSHDIMMKLGKQQFPDVTENNYSVALAKWFRNSIKLAADVCPNCNEKNKIKWGNAICDKCVAELYDENK